MQQVIKAPFSRTEERIWSISADVIIVCVVMLIQSFFNFGYSSVLIALVCTAVTVAVEFAASKIAKIPLTLGDLSGVKSGLLLSMLLSPASPLWFAALAGLTCGLIRAAYIKKSAMPVIPAALAAGIISAVLPNIMFAYTAPAGLLSSVAGQSAVVSAKSSARWLMEGSVSPYSTFELFLGIAPGPIGASAIALCMCGFIYLCLKRSVNVYAVAAFVVECAVVAGAFPRGDYSVIESIFYELFSGSLIFCGVFFIGDKFTSPKHRVASMIYGVVAATLCILTRYLGIYEQTAWFVVIVMCLCSPLLEYFIWKVFKA
ncbi:MAG: RnfABCDGE type electron transport complex subunit D [Clostridia bacterium]|nr:RnfABCDGE type electron transport complex subunit D [Clostridia bacterium]